MRPDKKSLRLDALKTRLLIPSSRLARWNRRLVFKLLQWEGLSHAANICLYRPFRNEPDPSQLMKHLLSVRFYYPVTGKKGRMVFYRVSTDTEFRPGRYGISEPVGIKMKELRPSVRKNEKTVFVCPGTVFDGYGGRIGSGAGYYDRYLGNFRKRNKGQSVFVGICWQNQVRRKRLPVGPYDVSMDAVVTEKKIIRIKPEPEKKDDIR